MDFDELVRVIQSLNTEDAFHPRLEGGQWSILGGYLCRQEVHAGHLVIRQGDTDRTVHFLGQGSMQVFRTGGPPGLNKVAIVRPGSVVGEPALFADGVRMANVEAMTPCVLWSLRLARFEEMTARHPNLAIEVLRAAGAVLAARMRANMVRQVPVG